MSPVYIDPRLAIPCLQQADQVAAYLGWFFASGRSQPGRAIAITGGLWPLLRWCWSQPHHRRAASALCRTLLHQPGYGWRKESDVIEAMSREVEGGDPGRLPIPAVSGFLERLLAEGEQVRGLAQGLQIELEFLLPRLTKHPVFPAERIESSLRSHGMPEERIRYHREAVHPELQPYLGKWEISLGDRRKVKRDLPPSQSLLAIPIAAPACGQRSEIALSLRHGAELAAYFRLGLTGGEFTS